MANYDLGTARGEIVIDYRGDGVDKAEADQKRLTDSTSRSNQALSDVGRSTQRAGLAIAAGIGVAVASAANFESTMSAVKAVSGASAQEMDQLSKKALQLGADTKFSASEAGQAIEELVKAGISIPDVMNGAADATVALAAAGEVELPRAAEIAANAMNQFKLSAEDMPGVADTLAGAANASAISVDELAESLKNVGPVAQVLGVSLEETSAAIAILGNNGIKGSSAGTKLRAILSRLTPATDKAKTAMEELGIITKDGTNIFYDAEGSLKPLNEVVQILNDKTKDLTDQQKIAFTKKAFGLEAMDAAQIIMGETGASIDSMVASMSKTTAADVAATRMDNLKGSFEQLKGSIETLLIVAGTPLVKAMRGWVDSLTGFANAIMAIDPQTRNLIGKIVMVVGAMLLVGGTIMRVVAFVGNFVLALKAIPGAMAILSKLPLLFAAMTGPVGLIVAGIALLAAAAVIAYRKFAPFRELVNSIASAVKGGLVAAFNTVMNLVGQIVAGFQGAKGATGFIGFLQGLGNAARILWDALSQLWDAWKTSVLPILQQAGTQVWNALKDAWAQMAAVVTGTLWPALLQLWAALAPARALLAQIMPVLLKIVGAFLLLGPAIAIGVVVALAKLLAFLAPVAAVFIRIAAIVIGVFIRAFTMVATVVVTVISAIVRFVTAIITGFARAVAVVSSVVGAIIGFFLRLGAAIGAFVAAVIAKWVAFWMMFAPIVQAAWALIVAVVQTAIAILNAIIQIGLAALRVIFGAAWRGLTAIARAVWAGITAVVRGAMNAIRAVVSAIANAVRAIIVAAWRAISGNTNATWASISAAVRSRIQAARAVVASVVNAIRSVISSAWNAVKSLTVSAWNAIVSAVRSAVNRLMAVVRSIRGSVQSALAGAGSWLIGAGRALVQGFINGVSGMLSAAAAKVRELGNLARQAAAAALKIGSPSKIFEELGVFTIEGYIKGVEDMMTPLSRTMGDATGTGVVGTQAGIVNGQPAPQVSVASPTVVLPERMILRVGDREFTAYVDERADRVLSDAAAKIGRGRK